MQANEQLQSFLYNDRTQAYKFRNESKEIKQRFLKTHRKSKIFNVFSTVFLI